MQNISDVLLLALLWLAYAAIHSLLASLTAKRFLQKRWPWLRSRYRALFNLLALILLIPPLHMTYSLEAPPLWQWQGLAAMVANGLALTGIVGFLYSLRHYDSMDFLGLRQWRGVQEEEERFVISPLHRFVRHPWYLFALMIIWTRDMNWPFFITSLIITGYFFIGSYLEEKKLEKCFGQTYSHYRKKVPGIIPMPGRYLSKQQAAHLQEGDTPT